MSGLALMGDRTMGQVSEPRNPFENQKSKECPGSPAGAWSVCGRQHPTNDPVPRAPKLGKKAIDARARWLPSVLARGAGCGRGLCVLLAARAGQLIV